MFPDDVKSMAQSKTIWGTLLQIVALIALSQGWDIGDTNGLAEVITGLIGSALALWGRVTAVKKITGVIVPSAK